MRQSRTIWRALAGGIAIAMLLLSAPMSAGMVAVGTNTVTSTTSQTSGVTTYTMTWTSSAGGAVSGNTFSVVRGTLIQIKFVPNGGGTQPTDQYDVTLVDTNGVDMLNGLGTNLSNATSSILQWNPPLYNDATQSFDFVVANAGNAKGGTVYLWVRR